MASIPKADANVERQFRVKITGRKGKNPLDIEFVVPGVSAKHAQRSVVQSLLSGRYEVEEVTDEAEKPKAKPKAKADK